MSGDHGRGQDPL
jgi:hypothetical protein